MRCEYYNKRATLSGGPLVTVTPEAAAGALKSLAHRRLYIPGRTIW